MCSWAYGDGEGQGAPRSAFQELTCHRCGALEAPGSSVTLSPQRELWPPEKEDQVSDILFLPSEGQRDLAPCDQDG